MEQKVIVDSNPVAVEIVTEIRGKFVLLKAGALQGAILNSPTGDEGVSDAKGRSLRRKLN